MSNKLNIKPSVADWFTFFRIVASVSLIVIKPATLTFYVVCALCGLSDVVDGVVARATKTTSTFGAKIDSIADLLFYSIMLLKIFPVLWAKIPLSIWYGVAGVLVIRVITYSIVAIKFHSFASLHTYLNKLTGLMVFFVPFIINFSWSVTYCAILCLIATIASINELIVHLCRKKPCATQEKTA